MAYGNATEITQIEPGQLAGPGDKIETIIKLSSILNSSLKVTEIREQAITAVSTLVRCQAASLLLINQETGGLYFDVAVGKKGKYLKTIELSKGEGIAGWVAENNKAIIVKNPQNDPRFFKNADLKTGFKTENMVCVPVTNKSKIIGVLQAINKRNYNFDKNDARILVALSNQIGIALENAQLYDEVKESLYSVVNVLANTIEKRDPHSAGHSKRVAKYALAIGKEIKLTHSELVNLKLASLLHDVGMITIPDAVLHKKNRLSESEEQIIMTHMDSGVEIISEVKQLHKIIPAVKYHHEYYDGSGVFGLKGKSIPLFARIIRIADSFDSMTTGRPYARCKGYEGARNELIKQSGKLYDPDMINAFLKSKAFVLVARHYDN